MSHADCSTLWLEGIQPLLTSALAATSATMAPKAKAKAGARSGVFINGEEVEVLAWGDKEMLSRPCVDCGVTTGRFCDFCYAADRMPGEEWADGQLTPLCSRCDNTHNMCHFCRGLHWCTPPPTSRHETVPQ